MTLTFGHPRDAQRRGCRYTTLTHEDYSGRFGVMLPPAMWRQSSVRKLVRHGWRCYQIETWVSRYTSYVRTRTAVTGTCHNGRRTMASGFVSAVANQPPKFRPSEL